MTASEYTKSKKWAETGTASAKTDVKTFLLSKASQVYNDFEYEVISHTGDTEEEITDLAVAVYKKLKTKTKAWLNEMEVENFTINDDLTVDVNGNVNLFGKGLTSLPVQFGKVKGYFSCSNNQLTSLGCPTKSRWEVSLLQ